MGKITLLIFLSFIVFKIKASNYEGNAYKFLSKCIVEIANRDLNYKSTILLRNLTNNQRKNKENDFFESLITEIRINVVPIIIDANHEINDTSVNGDVLSIFLMHDCEDLEKINFHNKVINYLLIFMGKSFECQSIFARFKKQLITQNVAMVFQSNIAEQFIFLTPLFEMNETTCEIIHEVRLQEVNICTNGSLQKNKLLFPEKSLMNLKKCLLNTGIAEFYPYMMPNNNTRRYENLKSIAESAIRGSDVELLKIMMHYFNATVHFFYISRDKKLGFVDQTFLSFLLNRSLDICAGGQYGIYGDIFDYSGMYTSQSIVWVYSAERETRSWQSFVRKVNGLYFFLIFYIIYVVMWKIISKIDNETFSLRQTLLYSWGALVGTSSLQDARTIKQKIVNAMYLILALHLSAYISVQLYSYLTIQSPPRIYKTMDELMESDMKPYLIPNMKYFIKDQKYERFANTSGDCYSYEHCQEVIIEKKGATILIDGHMPVYQSKTALNDEARVIQVPEDILVVYHQMIMRKDIYFGHALRKVLLHLFEAGICKKLYEEAIGILPSTKGKFAAKSLMSNRYSCQSGCKITLTQSAGAFIIWIFGCILSFITFIAEILIAKYKVVKSK